MLKPIYIINFKRLVVFLLPTFLRKRRTYEYLLALIEPIVVLYTEFKKYRADVIYRLEHDSTVYSIENVLNDSFDPQLRRIEIKDVFEGQPLYFYEEAANKPVYFYPESDNKPVYFYGDSYFAPATTDFIVLMPDDLKPPIGSLSLRISEIKKEVDYYKLASKRYEIVWTKL